MREPTLSGKSRAKVNKIFPSIRPIGIIRLGFIPHLECQSSLLQTQIPWIWLAIWFGIYTFEIQLAFDRNLNKTKLIFIRTFFAKELKYLFYLVTFKLIFFVLWLIYFPLSQLPLTLIHDDYLYLTEVPYPQVRRKPWISMHYSLSAVNSAYAKLCIFPLSTSLVRPYISFLVFLAFFCLLFWQTNTRSLVLLAS